MSSNNEQLFVVRFRDCVSQEIDEFELWATSKDGAYHYILNYNAKHGTHHEVLNVWKKK